MVQLKDSKGNLIRARALLDTCATAHFMTYDFARRLQLPIHPVSISINAIGGKCTQSKGVLDASIHATHNDFRKHLSFLIVPKIADAIPNEPFPRDKIEFPSNLRLADPQFHLPRPVDILIGSGATLSLFSIGQINLSRNDLELILQKTQLGWVVAGGVSSTDENLNVSCNLLELTKQIAKFWLLEDTTACKSKISEGKQCELHYVQNTTRDSSGRYIVRLPFREGNFDFGNSRSIALRRFHGLQKRLAASPELKTEYERVMQEYIDLGHMSLVDVPPDELNDGYYLPHHAVIKSSSDTTKVRVVFDASAKTNTGISLNDCLFVGPTIQAKLFEHLLKIRFYRYVLTADIAKMYRYIWIHPDDRKFQRIIWFYRNAIRVFQLNTVTFGVAAAAFLAIRTIHKLADDERVNFPRGAQVLEEDFYVDDLITGADSLEELIQIRNEVIEILKCGGFLIRQWASNNSQALLDLSEKSCDIEFLTDENKIHKTLGIKWNTRSDNFIFSVNSIENTDKVTKRTILSEVAKIFDPLGFLGPIILLAKIIMQDCWKAKVTWDESVPSLIHTRWIAFIKQLSLIDNLSIPRRLLVDNPIDIQIHGFCDASKVGYGAVFYVRSCDAHNNVLVRLFCAKSRVAPVKEVTIPRLELCGALTLARLYREVQSTFKFSPSKVVCWSDSTIVLHWLKKEPDTLQTFESKRVDEINKISKNFVWRHVRTEHNPADALSRGQFPQEFLKNKSWFNGPSWLWNPESTWPIFEIECTKEIPGLKSPSCFVASTTSNESLEFFKRFSSYTRLTRVTSYCLRFLRSNNYKNDLSIEEIAETEKKILSLIQKSQFSKEIDQIKNSREIRTNKISPLNPFLDGDGLLRVGGRLQNADISQMQKHPILLPTRHHVTDLIIRETHERFHHIGIQSTLYALRHRFWLIDGKNQVRKIVRNCVKCIRFKASPIKYKMGNLPSSRVQQTAAFYHTGVDFFGPLFIKEKKFRNRQRVKVYGCVFICMSIKAVHIEIVSDLTTEGFLGALRRFIGRRGIPAHVYSDNGTNFVGARNQLQELYALFQSNDFKKEVGNYALVKNITWHFNPPLSPHFGGLWEAAVKSFKHHLKRVVGDRLFTFEELNTLVVEIESILNSRPLCSLSTDPNDPLALTPAHLLIGRPLIMLPDHDVSSVPDNRLISWRLITKARQDFWRRWQLEYLNELQKRQKWFESGAKLDKDAIVIIIDKQHPCGQWRLGRVVETHPGDDGEVRVATIRTANGTFERNTKLLCPLPVSA